MFELEQKKHNPEQSPTFNSCPVPTDRDSVSFGYGAGNPLFHMVPDAGIGDEAYQDGRFNGPEPPPWLSSLLWPPPENLFDIALRAGITAAVLASAVAAIALGRGIRAPRGMTKASTKPESSAAPQAPVAQPSIATPRLTPGSNEEMLRQAINHVKKMPESATQRTAALDDLLAEIQQVSKGYWKFTRESATDGSTVYYGGKGEALIVTPRGQLFLGGLKSGGMHLADTVERLFMLDFSRLRPVR